MTVIAARVDTLSLNAKLEIMPQLWYAEYVLICRVLDVPE